MSSADSTLSSRTIHIVLTGASGYLGQHLLASWMDDAAKCKGLTMAMSTDGIVPSTLKITALYHRLENFPDAVDAYSKKRFLSSDHHRAQVSTKSLDLTDVTAVQAFQDTLSDRSLDAREQIVVVHTAALSNPRACQDDPTMARALNIPTHFFNAMKDHPLIALSTDQVYSGMSREHRSSRTTDEKIDDDDGDTDVIERGDGNYYTEQEQDDLRPVNVYGETKLEMERFLTDLYGTKQSQSERARPRLAVLRSSIILGPPGPVCEGAHSTFLDFCQSRGQSQQDTTFYTNEYRSVVSVGHVIRVINDWIVKNVVTVGVGGDDDEDRNNGIIIQRHDGMSPPPAIFNMGGPNRVSRLDMAQAVFDYFQYDASYLIPDVQTSPISPLDISMDSSLLLQKGFGGRHEPETLQGLVEYCFSPIKETAN